MPDANEPVGDAKLPEVANGPGLDAMLGKQGIEIKAPNAALGTAERAPDIGTAKTKTSSDEKDTKKTKSVKPMKAESALVLLERLAAKPDNVELKMQVESALAGFEMNPFESAVAQVLGVADGKADGSQFVLENFKSKKLLTFAIKAEPPLLPARTLVEMSFDAKYKSNLAALGKALKYLKDTAEAEVESAVLATLRSALRDGDVKTIAGWLEKTVLPLQIQLSFVDGASLLSALYGKMNPTKGASSALKELMERSIEWLTQPQNLAQLGRSITDASGLGAASYAVMMHETRKMQFKTGTARYHFVMSLLKPRERKTVTFLAQSGITKDFSLEAIGLLAENEESYSRISENESTLAAMKDECRRRLKSEELPRVHFWLLKYPNVRNWLTDALILQRLRPQEDFLSELFFADGRQSGLSEAGDQAVPKIEVLKSEIALQEKQIRGLEAELQELQERYADLEKKLRGAALGSQGARDDQIRQAQIDSIKVLIEFMNVIEMSGSNSPGVQSAIDSARDKLKSFGVAWRYEIGDVVPFVAHDHLASDLADGADVKILTPCYFMVNTSTQIALVKARVLPQ